MSEEEISELDSKAKELISKGRLYEARKLVDKILEEDPKHKSAIFKKAYILSQKDKIDEALNLFEKLIDMGFDVSKNCLDDAKDLSSDYSKTWFVKSKAYEEKGDKEKARECVLKYLDIDEDADFPFAEAVLKKRNEE